MEIRPLKTRLFLILFLPGMAGILSILFVDLSALVALVPVPPGTEIPTITPALKLLSVIQPTLVLAVAVLVGVNLALKVGLSVPVAESIALGHGWPSALKPQVVPGLLGGAIGSVLIVLLTLLFKPLLLPETVDRISAFVQLVPLPTRLLYGGITEELLLRWGFMSLLVWLSWRLIQRKSAAPTQASFIAAILLSSLVFGLGHLPIAFLLSPDAGVALVLFVVIANSAFGLIAGYLYWRKGLESAIIAHMSTHLAIAGASYIGLYF
jgi:hypothetical protein